MPKIFWYSSWCVIINLPNLCYIIHLKYRPCFFNGEHCCCWTWNKSLRIRIHNTDIDYILSEIDTLCWFEYREKNIFVQKIQTVFNRRYPLQRLALFERNKDIKKGFKALASDVDPHWSYANLDPQYLVNVDTNPGQKITIFISNHL